MRLKILFLSHKFFPDIGGIEVNSEVLAHAFTEAGHDVRLLTWSKDSTGKKFPFSVIRNPGNLQLLKEHAWADVVFENNPCLRLAWPGLIIPRPSVIALNTWISRPDGKIGLQDKIKKQWLRRAEKVISVSDSLRARCWPEAIVIGNPYWYELFKLMPDMSRTKDFVFLGRLVSDKGADQAIHALYNLLSKEDKNRRSRSSKISLTIIGDGPEKSSLKGLVERLKIQENVKFTGPLRGEPLVKELNQHRFLLVPSVWEEPFGNVALEGMACGCVPIVSDGGGLPDAVGNAGLKFQRGNVDALCISMKRVLEDGELVNELRERAKPHLANHHPVMVAKKYLDVIESAIKSNESNYLPSYR